MKKTCPYYFCLWYLIGKYINSAIKPNICYLISKSLLLNSKNDNKNRDINKYNDNHFFEKNFTTQNLQSIFINFNLDLTLINFYIIAIHPILYKSKIEKIGSNTNKKYNTSFYILTTNELNISFHNFASISFIYK